MPNHPFFRRLFLLFFFSILAVTLSAQQWLRDSFFGEAGLSHSGFGREQELIDAIQLQSDGKIIAFGRYSDGHGPLLARYLPDGQLDTSFGLAGRVVFTQAVNVGRGCKGLLVLPDDNILIVVPQELAISSDTIGFGIFRFLPNGIPDLSFGVGGQLWYHAGPGLYEIPRKVVLQPDGRIVVAGYSESYSSSSKRPFLARFLPSGMPDSSFGANGHYAVPLDAHQFDHVSIQADGRILAAGSSFYNGNSVLARFLPEGSPDTSFGNQGYVLFGEYQQLKAAFELPDGKILTGGWQHSSPTTGQGPVLRRYLPDGALDTSFGLNGQAVSPSNLINILVSDMLIQTDGKVLLTTYGLNEDPIPQPAIFRFQSNGSLDSSFAQNGLWLNTVGANKSMFHSIVLTPQKKILLGGSSYLKSDLDFTLLQLESDGIPDISFGAKGISRIDLDIGHDIFYQILDQPNGAYTLAGTLSAGISNWTMVGSFPALTHLQNDGQLDTAYNFSGTTIWPKQGRPARSALQTDGKTLTAWEPVSFLGYFPYALTRVRADGQIDSTFGLNGTVDSVFGALSQANLNQISVLPNGKIVVAGDAFRTGNTNRDWALACFSPDGSRDLAFGVAGILLLDNFGDDYLHGLCITAGGQVLLGGNGKSNGQYKMVLAQLHPDGTLDSNYGQNGIAFEDFGDGLRKDITSMVLQADQSLVAAVNKYAGTAPTTYVRILTRFNSDGGIDPKFGNQGYLIIDPPSATNFPIRDILLLPNGKIRTLRITEAINNGPWTLSFQQHLPNGFPDTNAQVHETVIADAWTVLPVQAVWPVQSPGREIVVPFRLGEAADLSAWQMGIGYSEAELEFTGLLPGDIPGLEPESYADQSGRIRILWYAADGGVHSFQAGATLFYLRFRLRQIGSERRVRLEEPGPAFANLAFAPGGFARLWDLSILESSAPPEALVRLVPNPSAGALHLQRSDPAAPGLLRIYSATGALVLQREIAAGPETVHLPEAAELPAGAYWWRFFEFGAGRTFGGRLVQN